MVCDLPKVTKLLSDRLDLSHFAFNSYATQEEIY